MVFAWQRWKTVVLEKNVSRETKCFVFVAFFGLEKHEEGYQVQLYYGTRTKLDSLPFLIGNTRMNLDLASFSLPFRIQKSTESNFKLVPEWSWTRCFSSFEKEEKRRPSPTLIWYQFKVGLGAFLASTRKRKGGRVQL